MEYHQDENLKIVLVQLKISIQYIDLFQNDLVHRYEILEHITENIQNNIMLIQRILKDGLKK
jgi:hypothetical protein